MRPVVFRFVAAHNTLTGDGRLRTLVDMRVLAPELYRAIRDEIVRQGESDVEPGPTDEQEPKVVTFLLVEPALAIDQFTPYHECAISRYWPDDPWSRSRWARFKRRVGWAVEDWAFGWVYPLLTVLADLGYLTLKHRAENDYALVLRAENCRRRALEECFSFERSNRPRGGAFLKSWEVASPLLSSVLSRNNSSKSRLLQLRKLTFLTRQLGFKTLARLNKRRVKQRSILQLQALELSVV